MISIAIAICARMERGWRGAARLSSAGAWRRRRGEPGRARHGREDGTAPRTGQVSTYLVAKGAHKDHERKVEPEQPHRRELVDLGRRLGHRDRVDILAVARVDVRRLRAREGLGGGLRGAAHEGVVAVELEQVRELLAEEARLEGAERGGREHHEEEPEDADVDHGRGRPPHQEDEEEADHDWHGDAEDEDRDLRLHHRHHQPVDPLHRLCELLLGGAGSGRAVLERRADPNLGHARGDRGRVGGVELPEALLGVLFGVARPPRVDAVGHCAHERRVLLERGHRHAPVRDVLRVERRDPARAARGALRPGRVRVKRRQPAAIVDHRVALLRAVRYADAV